MMKKSKRFIPPFMKGWLVVLLTFGMLDTTVYGLDEGDSAREAELARARLKLEHAKAALYEARKTLALLMEEQGPDSSEQGFLGIFMMPASREGVRVANTLPGAAAAKAGILEGDLIVAINDEPLLHPAEPNSNGREAVLQGVYDTLANIHPGDEVRMKVQRGNRRIDTILIAEAQQGEMYCDGDDGCRPFGHEPLVPFTSSAQLMGRLEPNLDMIVPTISADPQLAATVLPFMEHYGRLARGLPKRVVNGLELAELNAGLGQYFGTSYGVLVVHVTPDGLPGLRSGDVILSCGEKVVNSPRKIMQILMSFEQGDSVDLTVMRDQKVVDVTVQLSQSVAGLGY
jgi:PDZ domain-containing protein